MTTTSSGYALDARQWKVLNDSISTINDNMLLYELANLGTYTCNSNSSGTEVYLADKYTVSEGYRIIACLPYTNNATNTFGLVINTMSSTRGFVFRPHNISSGSCTYILYAIVVLVKE